jgi:hypothetical protein
LNRDFLIWLAIGAALIAATGTGVALYNMSRGLRNNNPGNIRHGGSQWQGMRPEQTDTDFVQFVSPGYGIRALGKLLQNYQSRYGLNTVRAIVDRYAPPSENVTGAYIDHVARAMQVSPDAPLNLQDTATLAPLVNAIIKHENGLNPYPDALVRQSLAMV